MNKTNENKTAIKLINKYADEYHLLKEEITNLTKENKDLKSNLKINKDIINSLIQCSNMNTLTNDKKLLLVNKLVEENTQLTNQYFEAKKEKDEILTNFKFNEQLFDQKIIKLMEEKEKMTNQIFLLENSLTKTEGLLQIALKKTNKSSANEILIFEPATAVNLIHTELIVYKEMNQRLINEYKQLRVSKDKYVKEVENLEKELAQYKQKLKSNSMNSKMYTSTSEKKQCCTADVYMRTDYGGSGAQNKSAHFPFNKSNSLLLGKSLNKSSNLIKIQANLNVANRLMDYEEYNHNEKEIPDMTEEWQEALKFSNMTQQEYISFTRNKAYQKLCDAIELLYKLIMDKNSQIFLLTDENNCLNKHNIALNRDNILLTAEVNSLNEELKRLKPNKAEAQLKVTHSAKTRGDTGTQDSNSGYKINENFDEGEGKRESDQNIPRVFACIMNKTFDTMTVTSSEFREGILYNCLQTDC